MIADIDKIETVILIAGRKLNIVGGSSCTATIARFVDRKYIDTTAVTNNQILSFGEYVTDQEFQINVSVGSLDFQLSPINESLNVIVSSETLSTQLSGFASTTGTLSSSDTVLTAFNKVNGNVTLNKTLLGNVTGTGYLTGCTVSINADNTKFDVSAGKLVFTDNFTDPSNPTVQLVDFAGATGVTPANPNGSNSLGINNLGQVVQVTGTTSSEQRRDIALIGGATTQAGVVINASNGKVRGFDLAGTAIDLVFALGILNLSGNDYSANGANLKINRSAGSCFFFGNVGNNKDPNNKTSIQSLADQFFTVYRNGSGRAVISALTDTIETTKYDNGTGTLATLGNNKWCLRWITYIPPANLTRIAYGQAEYSSMEAAIAGIQTEAPVLTASNITSAGTQVRGVLVFKKGATNLSDPAQAQFRNGGTFGILTNTGGVANALQNIQGVYDASVSPELLTDITRGALTVKRGSVADTDSIYEGQNGAGVVNFSVTGEGVVKSTGVKFNTVLKTAAYVILSNDYTIRCDTTSGIFNATLPDATLYTGQVFIIKKIDASANAATVNTTSSQTIDGATTYVLSAQYQTVRVQSNGANWNII